MSVVFVFSDKKYIEDINNKKLKFFKEHKERVKKSIAMIIIFIIIATGIGSAIVMHDSTKRDIKFNIVSAGVNNNNITYIVLNITGNINSINKS